MSVEGCGPTCLRWKRITSPDPKTPSQYGWCSAPAKDDPYWTKLTIEAAPYRFEKAPLVPIGKGKDCSAYRQRGEPPRRNVM